MTGMQETALGRVVGGMIAFRGFAKSPEKLAQSFTPPRLSASTIRRIQRCESSVVDGDDGTLYLMTLAGMLQLPVRALVYVRDGDAGALRALEWRDDDAEARQFVIDTVEEMTNPPRNRRASDKKRASR